MTNRDAFDRTDPAPRGGPSPVLPPLTYVGGDSRGGTYVLRVRVSSDLTMPFGRFKGGKVVRVSAGDHAYVGSALGEAGAVCLARRLVRHATRTGGGPPHPIRDVMLAEFPLVELVDAAFEPPPKKPKWNVDHLLDRAEAELVGAVVVRSPERLEFAVADLVASDPAAVVFERGLGANDHPGGTHLVRIDAGEEWWRDLPGRLGGLLAAQEAAGPRLGHGRSDGGLPP